MNALFEPLLSEAAIAPLCELFSIAENATNYSKSDVVRLATQCEARELNRLILDLDTEREVHRRRAYELSALIGMITDELRRRAELFESNK